MMLTHNTVKNILLGFLVILGIIYSLPNLYGENPVLEISSLAAQPTVDIPQTLIPNIKEILFQSHIPYLLIESKEHKLWVYFPNTNVQIQAKTILDQKLSPNYITTLNLVSKTPVWLKKIGAHPMRLGLDLRGGIAFTLEVDIDSVLRQRIESIARDISLHLRDAKIRYQNIQKLPNNAIILKFNNPESLKAAETFINTHYPELQVKHFKSVDGGYSLLAHLTFASAEEARQRILEQTMETLRHRIDELGIAEAIVQQQGTQRISIELPGVLDSTHAKKILGDTATLEFHLVDTHPSILSTPYTYQSQTVFLKNQTILSGNSITNAQSSYDEMGNPAVNIQLGGGGENLFHRVTAHNIGQPLAIIYTETKIENGHAQPVKVKEKTERIISIATINAALSNNFQITGLSNPEEAQNLALLLRAGALPANLYILEEHILGPKLGIENIHKGIGSIILGMILVAVFMLLYYNIFGLIANVALCINLILLTALLSLLGMTLTLPGMAGIVLTVGMAVDANVLIFERIREELHKGQAPKSSIHIGYQRAFSTIIDANITTFIVAIILFSFGTGPIKGFAVTLSLGLLTSMLSGITITRAIVDTLYRKRPFHIKMIGIKT